MYTTWSRKIGLFIVAIVAVSTLADAQQNVWSVNNENRANIATDKAVARQSFPKEFKLFNLNIEPFRQQLFSIVDSNGRQQSTVISLPNADGNLEQFEVFEASNFEQGLQSRFPDIRAYSGRGITDRYATLKLSISPQGIQGTVFRTAAGPFNSGGETEIIEPFSADRATYAVFKSLRRTRELPWACSTEEHRLFSDWKSQIDDSEVMSSNEGTIRVLRLVQSCNGEYANYFGAFDSSQVSLVLAAFNATLARSNGVYEKDLGVHLDLLPQSTSVIFYNPATDPYTTLSNWNNQLSGAIAAAGITPAQYDIGHMFGASGGGGNAGCIGCVCSPTTHDKGRGITSPADGIPQGDNFDIDYVVHEVGHQLGANHTFSYGQLPIPEDMGQDKEPGSGVTIMGYAGITEVDIAPHSIDVFHATSIAQVQANLPNTIPDGVPCPAAPITMTANSKPIVAPVSNYTIPRDTPFALTGSATDPEGDPITYNWEQNDSAQNTGITVAASNANPAKTIGPNWRSFAHTSSPTKMFPKLETILAGQFTTSATGTDDAVPLVVEALSSVTRDLNFRLTVRDNRPYVPGSTIAQTQFTDMTVSVTSVAGPFKVSAPNTNVSWTGGTLQTVTWDVATTTAAPISTANVKISLSTNSGTTFPVVLAASTPNDGTQSVLIPATSTSNARIKVEAVGNIFFDISDTNFTINSPTSAPANLGGRITTANGQPIGGVNVTLLNTGSLLAIQASTTANGIYHFDQVDTGVDYLITPNLDGYSFNPSNTFISHTGERLDIDFVATGSSAQVRPPPFDFDGDGRTDISVFRPSEGVWFIRRSSDQSMTAQQFGIASDRLVPGDYDGDSRADIAVFRQGSWYILQSSNGAFVSRSFGQGGDIPVPAYFDGDARTDLAVFRQGLWYIMNSSDNSFRAHQFGVATDQPAIGDYDGDSLADLAVFRNGYWYLLQSAAGFRAQQFGLATDIIVPGDYDGDAKTDLTVFRNGEWTVLRSSDGTWKSVAFGLSGDRPTPGDYDGDRRTDISVFRPVDGAWYQIFSSNNSFKGLYWGARRDMPVPGANVY